MNKLELVKNRNIIQSKIFRYSPNDTANSVHDRICFSFHHLPTLGKKVKVTGNLVIENLVVPGSTVTQNPDA